VALKAERVPLHVQASDDRSIFATSNSIDMSYLKGTIGYSIRRAQMSVFDDIFCSFGEYRVTTTAFSVLAVAADNPGINQVDLASALGVVRQRMVPIIDELERRGLASRIVDGRDGRARCIHLTKPGNELLQLLKARFAEHQQRMLMRLGMNSSTRILSDLWKLADG